MQRDLPSLVMIIERIGAKTARRLKKTISKYLNSQLAKFAIIQLKCKRTLAGLANNQ